MFNRNPAVERQGFFRRGIAFALKHPALFYIEDIDMRIYDSRFKYTPSMSTNIVSTWKRHGFKPTTEAERIARQRRAMANMSEGGHMSASVTQLDAAKRKVRVLRKG